MRRFVDRVLAEARIWGAADSLTVSPQTIFFGGGTPSLLPAEEMARLITGLRDLFDCSKLTEWTVEVNPATASFDYCQMLRSLGVDRLSFGGQSFDPSELKMLERHHDPDDVPRSIELARRAGFKRLNVDLIYAIPNQTMSSWQRSLEAAIALGLSHYSCYGLTYEPNTPIAVRRRLGQFQQIDESLELEMMHHTRQRLAQIGCPAYEISNYASPSQECQHNLLYWKSGDYLGLGPSGASHVQGYRFKNRPHLGEWENAIDRNELPATDFEILTPQQRAGEAVMLSLRLSNGLDYDDYSARTGFDARVLYAEQIERLSRLGLLEVDNQGFRLTRAGLNVADAIASEFLIPQG